MLAAQPTLPPEVLQHAKAGLEAQKDGRFDEAIAAFTRVTQLAPTLPAAHVNLGNAYMQKGDYGPALEPLRRALELNPELPGAQQMLGHSLLAAGFASESIPYLEKTKSLDVLGIALFQAGRTVEAIVQLQTALDQRPNDPELLYYLGRASAALSKQNFDALRAGHPDSARTHQLLGEMEAAQRKLPQAEMEFREALRLRPQTPGVRLQLGTLYADSGQWDKAEIEFRSESQARPGDAEAAYRLGHALLEQGKVKDARKELARADSLAPSMPETLYALGKSCSLDRDAVAAEKHWLSLLALEKESALAAQTHFALAALYRQQGKPDKAAAAMREYQRLKK
jgi:tetratricopeptide (TPR) repeat protein